MAKAVAICTCSVCGKSFEKSKNCFNRKEADAWEQWAVEHYDRCYDCEKTAQLEKMAEQERANGFAQLKGTEKQVKWAREIRYNAFKKCSDILEQYSQSIAIECDGKEYTYKELFDTMFQLEDESHWWIENFAHGNPGKTVLCDMISKRKSDQDNCAASQIAIEAVEEALIKPEAVAKDQTAVVKSTDRHVFALLPTKDEEFSAIVKKLGYRWNPEISSWYLTIGITHGEAEDRAAELTTELLRAGFCVEVQNSVVREKVVSGDYAPVYPRWIISKSDDREALYIRYPNDAKINNVVRSMGARWNSGNSAYKISASLWRRVLDFASAYDFRFSPGAEKIIARQKESLEAALTIKPASVHKEEPKSNGIDALMNNDGIIPDLEDNV